ATGGDEEPTLPAERPVPVGDLIDRAARMVSVLGTSIPPPSRRQSTRASPWRRPIAVDATTAGLLRTRFDVRSAGPAFVLWGERDPVEAPRTLLGKPTECVGREVELERLERSFDD